MELVIGVVMLALAEFIVFSMQVGAGRVKYGVKAPATSGHEQFDRLFRIQQNTLEQLVLFIPAIFSFAWVAEAQGWYGHEIAASLGLVWLVGRALYAMAYAKAPATRSAGFILTLLPSCLMILGTLLCVVI